MDEIHTLLMMIQKTPFYKNRHRLLILIIGFGLLLGCEIKTQSTNDSTLKNKQVLTATAELISLESINISPPSVNRMRQYKIKHLVKENTKVKKGDVIIKFDIQDLRNRLYDKDSQLKAEIKKAESLKLTQNAKLHDLTLALAEAKMKNDKEKRKASITDKSLSMVEKHKQKKDFEITQIILQQAEDRLKLQGEFISINNSILKSKVNNLTIQVAEINENIEKMTIKSPKTGIVMYKSNWKGEKPAIGEIVHLGSALVAIPSLATLAVKAEFDESDTIKLYISQKVKVILAAYPERSFNGKITSFGQSYRNKSKENAAVVFDAIIRLDQLDLNIMSPGMQAKIEVSLTGKST